MNSLVLQLVRYFLLVHSESHPGVLSSPILVQLFPLSAYFSALKMEASCSSKMPINIYQITRRHVPEEASRQSSRWLFWSDSRCSKGMWSRLCVCVCVRVTFTRMLHQEIATYVVTLSMSDAVKQFFFCWKQVVRMAPHSTLGTRLAGPFVLKKCIDISPTRQGTETRFNIGFTG